MESIQLRKDQKEATRRLLLDTARRVFGRDGILATPVSVVAREADRAHGSVFVHFGSQDGLVSAVVEDFGLALARDLERRYEAGADLRQVLEAHLAGLATDEDFYRRLVVEGPLLPPQARLSWVSIQSILSFHLTPAFEAGVASGRYRGTTPAFLFNLWVGLVHHHLAHRDLFAPGGSVIEERGQDLLNQFVSLVEIPT